jgi:hypothetical protein
MGSIAVGDDGRMRFVAGAGKAHSLTLDPSQTDKILATLVEVASAKIPAPQQRVRPPAPAGDKAAPAPQKPL